MNDVASQIIKATINQGFRQIKPVIGDECGMPIMSGMGFTPKT